MEGDDAEWEDLISSMGPRTLDLEDENNLNFSDEDECSKGKSYFEVTCDKVVDFD